MLQPSNTLEAISLVSINVEGRPPITMPKEEFLELEQSLKESGVTLEEWADAVHNPNPEASANAVPLETTQLIQLTNHDTFRNMARRRIAQALSDQLEKGEFPLHPSEFAKALTEAVADAHEVVAYGLHAEPPKEASERAKAFARGRSALYRDSAKEINALMRKTLSAGAEAREDADAVLNRFEQALKVHYDRLADTEAQAIYGDVQAEALQLAGFTHKRWVSMRDDKVRDSHYACDMQGPIPVAEKFKNGLRHPGDSEGPIEEVVNCRCWLVGVNE